MVGGAGAGNVEALASTISERRNKTTLEEWTEPYKGVAQDKRI
jgi:hypothetical protein